MSYNVDALVIGMGEIGKPLYEILLHPYDAAGRDIEQDDAIECSEVLHICFPWSLDFVAFVEQYVKRYNPGMVIIHSTVVPGTTRQIYEATHSWGGIAYSPVRGRHGYMLRDMLRYDKLVACPEDCDVAEPMQHLAHAGFNVRGPVKLETLELAKLFETTYSAILIAWAQEMQRYCDELGVDREAALCLTEEPPYLPDHVFYPGFIGGHCLIPNLDLLDRIRPSLVTEFIRQSNEQRKDEIGESGERHYPKRIR